jgi:hypothetical protein
MNRMGSFAKIDAQTWRSLNPEDPHLYYRPCYNYSTYQACNWVIPAEQDQLYCESCQLTHIIPDLSVEKNLHYCAILNLPNAIFYISPNNWGYSQA